MISEITTMGRHGGGGKKRDLVESKRSISIFELNARMILQRAFALTLFDALREFSSKTAGTKIKRALAKKKAS
jgi:hypothetical protein